MNLIEYCKARRKCFEGLSDYSQPLVEVSGVAMTGNHLNPTTRAAATEPVKAAVKCTRDSALKHRDVDISPRFDSGTECQVYYSCKVMNSTLPTACRSRILTLFGSTFRTALLLPSITKRIEDFLIVHELNANLFGYSIHENLLLSAISAPSAGFEVDYERLEFFGLILVPPPFRTLVHACCRRFISEISCVRLRFCYQPSTARGGLARRTPMHHQQ